MPQSDMNHDPYPASDFDQWAARYDDDVAQDDFPFTGYRRVLSETVRLASPVPGMAVLDLGLGTGNLSELFLPSSCELWGTDFSGEMLEKARVRLPSARLFLHDLRQPFPPELNHRFERVVSAYVFHHFILPEKIEIIEQILQNLLAPFGRLLVADISFPTQQDLAAVRQQAGDQWDEEEYWIAADALPALAARKIDARYVQISNCAGIYQLSSA